MNPSFTRCAKWIAAGLLLAGLGWWRLRQYSPDSLARGNQEAGEAARQNEEGPRRPPPLSKGLSKNSAKLPMLMEPIHDFNGNVIGYQLAKQYRKRKARVEYDELSGWPYYGSSGGLAVGITSDFDPPGTPPPEVWVESIISASLWQEAKLMLRHASESLPQRLLDGLEFNSRASGFVESAVREMEALLKALEKQHCRAIASTDLEQTFEITHHTMKAAAVVDGFRNKLANLPESTRTTILKRLNNVSVLNGLFTGMTREIKVSQNDEGEMMIKVFDRDAVGRVVIERTSIFSHGIHDEWSHLFQLEP